MADVVDDGVNCVVVDGDDVSVVRGAGGLHGMMVAGQTDVLWRLRGGGRGSWWVLCLMVVVNVTGSLDKNI